MEGAMMEYSVDLTVTEHGRNEESGSLLFEAFERIRPGSDAVLAQNVVEGWLSTVFRVDARDADDALARARPIFEAALAEAGLQMTRLIGVEVHLSEVAAPAA
jgi:enamine deaminase RidA (YjgF/YER057c/UK114 family)